MPIDAPAIGGVADRVKRVPKLVWIAGGGIVLGFVILKGKGGGSTAATGTPSGLSSSVGGGGGSSDTGTGQSTISADELTQFLADQAQQNTDFQQGIMDIIGTIQPPTPVGGGPTGGDIPPSNGSGGTVVPPIPVPGGTKPGPLAGQFTIHLRGLTNIYNAKGVKIGTGRTGTSVGTLVNIKGKSFYKTVRGGKTVYIPKAAKTITAVAVKPAVAKSAPTSGLHKGIHS